MLWFLNNNGILYREDGSKRLADNTLVALTLMIAESKTEDGRRKMADVGGILRTTLDTIFPFCRKIWRLSQQHQKDFSRFLVSFRISP
jgi:hypothetical protein